MLYNLRVRSFSLKCVDTSPDKHVCVTLVKKTYK